MLTTAASVVADARQALKPPPRLKLSEWADEHFYLSAESSAEPGRWSTLPYQREPMDAMTDTRVGEVTFMKSARVGYTKMLNALIGYHIVHDPCSILLVQPTEDDAKGYSKEEIEPMLRDIPEIGERFIKPKNQLDSLLHKRFRGGILQLAGARSPGNFRRVSRRTILEDEIDGYPMSAGKEGDPLKLAERRAEYFWNRKVVRGSTPTDQGSSRIEEKFLEGDQRRCYVPCPHCEAMQVLVFQNLRWENRPPGDAVFICISAAARSSTRTSGGWSSAASGGRARTRSSRRCRRRRRARPGARITSGPRTASARMRRGASWRRSSSKRSTPASSN
jgi:phage terminase large subunit GpA-like protein